MSGETISYNCDGLTCQGYLVLPKEINNSKKQAVLIAPAWYGIDKIAKQKAQDLAELGYIAFVADLYGNGTLVKNDADAFKMMLPLFLDRKLIRSRIVAAYEELSKHALVDKNAMGAIGFCFGGMTVIELLRSGVDVKGVVSFHGLLGYKLNDHQATPAASAKMKGALLILHGHDDPSVRAQDIADLQKEMTQAKVDWQMNIYGQTMHAFTNPEAHDPQNGKEYNPRSSQRAWKAMSNFFTELFTKH